MLLKITCLFCYRAHLLYHSVRSDGTLAAGRSGCYPVLCDGRKWGTLAETPWNPWDSPPGWPGDTSKDVEIIQLKNIAARRRYIFAPLKMTGVSDFHENWRWLCFWNQVLFKLPGRGKHCCNGSMGQWRGTWLETLQWNLWIIWVPENFEGAQLWHILSVSLYLAVLNDAGCIAWAGWWLWMLSSSRWGTTTAKSRHDSYLQAQIASVLSCREDFLHQRRWVCLKMGFPQIPQLMSWLSPLKDANMLGVDTPLLARKKAYHSDLIFL